MAERLINLTSVREDADLIPGHAQWVEDQLLPWAVVQVAVMARIWRCCGCAVGSGYSSDATSRLGTSICHRSGPKRTKKKKIKKNLFVPFLKNFQRSSKN